MMVLQGTVGTLNPGIFPADKCVWMQVDDASGGYSIAEAVFIPGGNAPVGGGIAAQLHNITDPMLGFIGKSGRFVAISN